MLQFQADTLQNWSDEEVIAWSGVSATASVMENCGEHKFSVLRRGKIDIEAKIKVETIDGSAVEKEDYEPINQVLTFAPGEEEKQVRTFYFFNTYWAKVEKEF